MQSFGPHWLDASRSRFNGCSLYSSTTGRACHWLYIANSTEIHWCKPSTLLALCLCRLDVHVWLLFLLQGGMTRRCSDNNNNADVGVSHVLLLTYRHLWSDIQRALLYTQENGLIAEKWTISIMLILRTNLSKQCLFIHLGSYLLVCWKADLFRRLTQNCVQWKLRVWCRA